MAVNVKVVNWNIQNFGETKAKLADVVEAIAGVVHSLEADIFVMLEMNTTSAQTAHGLATTMLKALAKQVGGGQFQTCVLSPNTGKEFYAYFVRDQNFTAPVALSGPQTAGTVPATIGAAPDLDVSKAEFTRTTGTGIVEPFPLLTPDLPRQSQRGRALGIPPWTTKEGKAWRRPVLGLFDVAGAGLLPIVACHFDPDPATAGNQLEALQQVSLLAGSPTLQIAPSPGQPLAPRKPSSWMLIGDFNIDVTTEHAYYAPVTGGLGAGGWLDSNTLMMTPAVAVATRPKDTDVFAVKMIDEMFTHGTVTGGGEAYVANIAEAVRTKELRLGQSIDHYQELDQRGFVSDTTNAYQTLVSNFAGQLAGDKSHIVGLEAALIGARLISDHLPVSLEAQLS